MSVANPVSQAEVPGITESGVPLVAKVSRITKFGVSPMDEAPGTAEESPLCQLDGQPNDHPRRQSLRREIHRPERQTQSSEQLIR